MAKNIYGETLLTLIPASDNYFDFILKLRNDPRIRNGFIQQADISEVNHKIYMSENSKNYYVCMLNQKPIGYIGVIENDIRLAVSLEHNGFGAGEFMVKKILLIYPNAVAKIKVGNQASLRLFEKCGFEKKYFILEQD